MWMFLGLAFLIGGVYLLLVNIGIIKKTTKSTNVKPLEAKRIDNILIRIGALALCMLGIYLLYTSGKDDENNQNSRHPITSEVGKGDIRVWTNDLKEVLTKQCLENGKRTAEQYPELVQDYCKCATEKISQAMSPEEYTQWMEKPMDEQSAYIRPIVQRCVDIMTKLIQLSQETTPAKKPK